MIRPSSSAAALVAVLGLLASACGAPPNAEPIGASAQADTTSNECDPFTMPVPTRVRVCSDPDPDDITRKAQCWTTMGSYCKAESAPPIAPADGYGPHVPQSCSGPEVEPVGPPAELSQCTNGYAFGLVTAFLCPISVVNQIEAGTLRGASNPCGGIAFSPLSPMNGCFGAPLDPTNWGYVEVAPYGHPFAGMFHGLPICGQPIPCGAECNDLGTLWLPPP